MRIAIFKPPTPSSAVHCEKLFSNLALKTKRKINGKDHNWFSTRLLIADEFAFLQFIDCITARLNALHMHMVHENGGAISFEHLVQVRPSLRSRTQNDNTVRLKSERIAVWHYDDPRQMAKLDVCLLNSSKYCVTQNLIFEKQTNEKAIHLMLF